MKKYEQEIRELLDKLENFVPDNTAAERERDTRKKVSVMPPAPKQNAPRNNSGFSLSRWLRAHNLSAGMSYLIIGFGLVIVALIVNQEFPGQPWRTVAQVIAVIGAIFYLLPVFMRVFRGRDLNNDTKHWRGQTLEDEPIVNLNKLRQRFGKRGGNNRNPWNDRNRSNRW